MRHERGRGLTGGTGRAIIQVREGEVEGGVYFLNMFSLFISISIRYFFRYPVLHFHLEKDDLCCVYNKRKSLPFIGFACRALVLLSLNFPLQK